MSTFSTALNDQAFIEQFEALRLSATEFSHLGHLRIAWLYLRQYPQALAIEKTCSGIKTYAESLGAKDKFHLTITDALVRIMAIRMKEQAGEGWQAFADETAAKMLMVDCFAHATGLLLLLHTGRIRMFDACANERMDSFIQEKLQKLSGAISEKKS